MGVPASLQTELEFPRKKWVKCLCQVVEIVKVCPINFFRI